MFEFFNVARNTQVVAPSLEVLLLLAVLTVALVFKATRTGLFTAYLFTCRWGWMFVYDNYYRTQPEYVFGFVLFAALVLILSIVNMRSVSAD